MLGLKLNHVSKRAPGVKDQTTTKHNNANRVYDYKNALYV